MDCVPFLKGSDQVTSYPLNSPQVNQANQANHWITDVTGQGGVLGRMAQTALPFAA
jgi:hypothetical protein